MEPNTEWGASGHDTTAWQGSLSPPELEARLSHMLAYRELCRAVQRSGRENFFFAALMAFFAHLSWQNGGANNFFLLVYGVFIIGELGIALYKWLWPSAEGVLGDALVMLAFALLNGLLAYVQFQAGLGPNPILAFLTGLSLLATWRHWQAYRHLRQLFSIRPTRQQLRWFEGFVRDIRQADPHTDSAILDLPTKPGFKVLLLGPLVVAVETRRHNLHISNVDSFGLVPVADDTGEKRDCVRLLMNQREYPPFVIDPASWSNYQRWRREQQGGEPVGGGVARYD